jgi:hypothetical protein
MVKEDAAANPGIILHEKTGFFVDVFARQCLSAYIESRT